ncbi:MAG: nucleotide-binding protein [Deltaproteobacteria bacterium]|nr:nucleotide-binding protein [Deltaproteobacteria bacterium]
MNNQSEYRLADFTATPLRALAITLALLTVVATTPSLSQATDAAAPAAAKQQPMRGMPGAAGAPQMTQPAGVKVTAEVLETMNAANYTYVRVKTASGDVWAAGPRTEVKVGDKISFDRGVPMTNFESKSLGRTFDSIDFVGRFVVGDGTQGAAGAASAPAAGGPPAGSAPPHAGVSKAAPTAVDLTGIAKAKDGKTVAEVFDQRTALSGKEVIVRGKVVKSNPEVMGHNWLHVRDGSKGTDGSDDLTLTTKDTAKVGDTVVVHGKVVTDKDFGFGYHYDVMLEEATVTVE